MPGRLRPLPAGALADLLERLDNAVRRREPPMGWTPSSGCSVSPAVEQGFRDLRTTHAVPCQHLGVTEGTGGGAKLEVADALVVSLADLRKAWSAPLPSAFSRMPQDAAAR